MAFFREILQQAGCASIDACSTCAHARKLLEQWEYGICIINSPLSDESGESLAVAAAGKAHGQVILAVRTAYFDTVTAHVEAAGVITIAKPLSRALFSNTVKMAEVAQKQLRRLQTENDKLMRHIEDIRVIDRAKCILISTLSMSEPEAHKYIEKQAMDMRKSKRTIAEGILRTYDN
jgi:response regulator NasT